MQTLTKEKRGVLRLEDDVVTSELQARVTADEEGFELRTSTNADKYLFIRRVPVRPAHLASARSLAGGRFVFADTQNDLLRIAREVLEDRELSKGELAACKTAKGNFKEILPWLPVNSGSATHLSALGALCFVRGAPPDDCLVVEAYQRLCRELGQDVCVWNDDPRTTKGDVLKLLW